MKPTLLMYLHDTLDQLIGNVSEMKHTVMFIPIVLQTYFELGYNMGEMRKQIEAR